MEFEIIPVTPFQQNCTLLICPETNKAALVDPGGEADRLMSVVESKGLELEKIFLTHAHLDHVGGTNQVLEATNVAVEGPHREDQFWLDMLDQQAQMFGFPNPGQLTPDRWLVQGDTVSFGNQILEVRFCPGHTPGHVVFYHRPSGLVLVGDVLFAGSVGRTDFPRGDFDTLAASIRRELWSLDDGVRFIPGHGPMSTIGHERQTNPFVADKNFG